MDICVDGDDWYESKEGMVLFFLKKKCFIVDCWNINNNNENKIRVEIY